MAPVVSEAGAGSCDGRPRRGIPPNWYNALTAQLKSSPSVPSRIETAGNFYHKHWDSGIPMLVMWVRSQAHALSPPHTRVVNTKRALISWQALLEDSKTPRAMERCPKRASARLDPMSSG